MTELCERMLAAARDRSGYVHLDVMPPRDAPNKQLVASLFEPPPGERRPMRPQGQAAFLPVTPEQARALLQAGAEWKGPAHLRAEVLPGSAI
ncbi:MAG TPA: hypothetical protein VFQ65_03310 [Kofleriaceae bacterium]|nr:hypothetical protein [Kofleriaceae bacterium]